MAYLPDLHGRRLPPRNPFVAGNGAPPPHNDQQPEASSTLRRLNGMRALLVEDQTIIALDTEAMLTELGFASVESFTTLDTALAWLQSAQADVGVLDIALGSSTSYPVADVLLERGIPFLFTTGYGDTRFIPERFALVPVVHKPYGAASLADGLALCLKLDRI